MAKRLSELGIMIVFGYTLWLIVSQGPTLESFFPQRALARLALQAPAVTAPTARLIPRA
jgi:hypothetical protein